VKRPARRRILLAALLAGGALAFLLWRPEAAPPSGAWLARAGLTPRFAEVNGLRLRYLRVGAGPPVLLLHGFASSLYTWAEVLPSLAAGHEVVAVDLPGFGGSTVRPDITAETLVEAVPGLLDRLGLARVDLVGHSLGGAVAAAVSVRHPERVETLVLVDAAGFNFASADRPWLLRLLASPAGRLFELLPVRRQVVALGLRQVFFDDARVTPERVDEYTAPLLRPGTVRALRSILRSPDSLGIPQRLSEIRRPTLVVWGADDTWIPLADAGRFLAAIPGARKVVISSCGHIPQEERPAELARALGEALGSGVQADLAR
jgi:pimeloyl-ACP methyl ester carboxylesterase